MEKTAKKTGFHLALLFICLVAWLIFDYLLFGKDNIILMILLLVLPFLIGSPLYLIIKMRKSVKREAKVKEKI